MGGNSPSVTKSAQLSNLGVRISQKMHFEFQGLDITTKHTTNIYISFSGTRRYRRKSTHLVAVNGSNQFIQGTVLQAPNDYKEEHRFRIGKTNVVHQRVAAVLGESFRPNRSKD